KEGTKAVAAEQLEEVPIFVATLTSVISQLKNRLQQQYERAYPGLGGIIRFVIDEEESVARDLCSPFPFYRTWWKRTSRSWGWHWQITLTNWQHHRSFLKPKNMRPRRWVKFINHLYLERFQLISSLERRKILRLEFQSGTL
ncbi:MAG: hypothetical protein QOF56_2693, partial [Acidobacteriaceae bacterium]|nr:hypothetical protein [Acidobacteriaceae bacterium]